MEEMLQNFVAIGLCSSEIHWRTKK